MVAIVVSSRIIVVQAYVVMADKGRDFVEVVRKGSSLRGCPWFEMC